MVESIRSWLGEVAGSVRPTSPGSIHMDEIKGWSVHDAPVDFAFAQFTELRERVRSEGLGFDCLLVWPLGSSEVLDTRVPKSLRVTDEPPSLYVVHPDAARIPDLGEEYRAPIAPEELGVPFADGYAYYRCFRTPEGIQNDWEYERCIYFVDVNLADG